MLVVDLDADSLDFACTVLEDCGAEVETASSGMEALEAVERLNPDVLAIDIEITALMERLCCRKCAIARGGQGNSGIGLHGGW